ncbi:hypothetical protein R55214_HHFBAMCI_01533 [Fructobacillus evanidus]|uniref:HTH cro/C1-type domain-containing protein n=1 Tax=Fructobacillus evanidus TaxID=3064281 RepID=A0ABN9Z4Y8_9LACO|nr:hypothetical protein R55250_KEHBDPNM_00461 [Fructobacillus sp. LMG 32999]CAK1243712.1 hypothetical protein R53534_HOPDCFKK_00938 [Fructobacillus sp. LMG 32999]CAK1254227.1 hypothetical protein R55214_HHFBAMCI_01533 [Fructobacillus sp. LMG 32999]CAK1254718.1 hypothetical protein R55234_GCHJJDIB_01519 [Fructobacillus sp. LMG 32999]
MNGFQITLAAARKNRSLSQKEVSNILKEKYGVKLSRQAIQRYEKDSSEISLALSEYLSEIYEIPKDYIFFGNESTLSYTNCQPA